MSDSLWMGCLVVAACVVLCHVAAALVLMDHEVVVVVCDAVAAILVPVACTVGIRSC